MTYQQHHAWFLVPAWGHITSAHALIVRMLQLNQSLVVTVVQHHTILFKVEADLALYSDLPRDRLHIVKAGKADPGGQPSAMNVTMEEYSTAWLDTLSKICSAGQDDWPKPTALILDQYGANLSLPAAKAIVGPDCKTIMHWTPSAACFYSFLAPSKLCGFSDYDEVVDRIYHDDALRKGRERAEILEEVCKAKNGCDVLNGTVVRVPGVKEMYDYEREANNGPTPPGLAAMLCEMVKLSKNTDGVIIASSETIEEAALTACNKFTHIYPVGIQLAPRAWDRGLSIDDRTIRTFLDQHDRHAVLFISFGSMFFPSTSLSHVLALIDTLLELEFPFLFGLGGKLAINALPEDIVQRVNSSGKGMIQNSWVDQQAILQHPAVGWFLTHGGWNSIAEGLAQGIPLVVWPLTQSDQAINAAMLSTRDGPVAFELMQIRQGRARAPALRGGGPIIGDDSSVKHEFRDIFTKAREREGSILRENAEAMAVQLQAERKDTADAVIRQLASI